MDRSKALPLILVLLLILPAIAIAIGPINEKLPFDKIGGRIAVFEDVITRSKSAGINTTGLEKISSKAKSVEREYDSAHARNDSKNKTLGNQKIARLSNNFTEDLLRIRAEQDKKDVERMISSLDRSILYLEKSIDILDGNGLDVSKTRSKLNGIKSRRKTVEQNYSKENYKAAENELRTAKLESHILFAEVKAREKSDGGVLG